MSQTDRDRERESEKAYAGGDGPGKSHRDGDVLENIICFFFFLKNIYRFFVSKTVTVTAGRDGGVHTTTVRCEIIITT